MSDDPIVVSYYTPSYENLAKRLEHGLLSHDMPSDIQSIETKGSWQRNCAYKASFIEQMRIKHEGRPVIWIDADATIERKPVLLLAMPDCHIAVRNTGSIPPHPWNRVMSGTVWFGPGSVTDHLVHRWKTLCMMRPQRWDQVSLAIAIEEGYIDPDNPADGRLKYRVNGLPESYCCVCDARPENASEPVIMHWQASRTNKAVEGDEGDQD